MNVDERTNRLRTRELEAVGVAINFNDEPTKRLIQELAVEKEAQVKGAKAVLKCLAFVAAIFVFVLCFWRYDVGLPLSIGAAILTLPVIGLGLPFRLARPWETCSAALQNACPRRGVSRPPTPMSWSRRFTTECR
jgi:hypothetical protein